MAAIIARPAVGGRVRSSGEGSRPAELGTAFGHSLHVDLYGVDRALCDDINFFYALLDDIVGRLGMHKQAPPFIFRSPEVEFPDKVGLSGWVPLIESGISIHTLTLVGFVSIDLYTCGRLTPADVVGYLVERLGASSFEHHYLIRGAKYHDQQPC